MREFLDRLLPRVLPEGVHPTLVPHEGKSDLEKSIPRKLRAWRTPNTRFIVVRDQDAGDCRQVKERLMQLCEEAGRPDTLVRIACRELEAFYLGDPDALAAVIGDEAIPARLRAARFRDVDAVPRPSAAVLEWAKDHGKMSLAREMGAAIHIDSCSSTSFQQLVSGVRRIVEEAG